jgi:RNA polymerase sigma-70 factor (ECF subfamily)
MDDATAREAAESVARRSYGKLVALLAARTRDVAGAEDALAEAFAAALVEWPRSGVPQSPEAWLRPWRAASTSTSSPPASARATGPRLIADEMAAA